MKRGSQWLAFVASLAMATACRRTSPSPPPDDGGAEPVPLHEPAAREKPGEEVTATIPLADGTTLDLESLRGRPVVLALAAPAGEEAAALAELVAEAATPHGSEPVVVLVASGEPTDFDALAQADDGERVIAYDPQGALAARLQVRALPTVFVVDRSGRLVDAWAHDIDATAVSAAIAQALASR